MNENTHEKYVSIEYDKWNNYYKPLEEENKELQRKLDGRELKVYTYRSFGYGHSTWDYMGVIDVNIDGGYGMDGFYIDQFVTALESQSGMRLRKTKEDIKREEEVLFKHEQLNKIPSWILKLFGVKPKPQK